MCHTTVRNAECGMRSKRRVNPKSKIQNPKCSRGFTLLELMMVVIIVGILAALALPQFMKTSEKARGAEATNELGALRTSIGRFCLEKNGTAPGNFNVLDVENPDNSGGGDPTPDWNYTFPTVACTTNPITVTNLRATRMLGPCATSTITWNQATGVFDYVWAGQCR